MPIFEFDCLDCQKSFEMLVGVGKPSGPTGRLCPVCQSRNVKKRVSLFASRSTGDSERSSGSSCASCSSSNCSTCG
ncbi:MAG: zinc ribbon domain-containing protein [Actinomycetia bacterium]|nr:zinc ribbon domain-containing protein [Actinomycetes bacterium]